MVGQFEQMGIDEDFNGYYEKIGIKAPTEIQKRVIPEILAENSVICVAQTGTGKTLAYALPIIELIKRFEDEFGASRRKGKPMAIVVAPTKELAVQIHQVFKEISHFLKLRVRSLVGQKSIMSELRSESYEVLVATPHKLAQALKKGDTSTEDLKYLIFDEADQLFDMGFKNDLNKIVHFVDFLKTNVSFFSATMDHEVENFLDYKFKKLNLKKIYDKSAHTFQQKIETLNISVKAHEKMNVLKMFLQRTAQGRGIVFVNQRNQVEDIDKFLQDQFPKLKYKILHGGLSQKERLSHHKSFVEGKAQVLIASDVMARGIDVKDLNWVFNYGLPKTSVYYLHRCGRVGRGGRTGLVYNLITPYDTKTISLINDIIKNQRSLEIDLIRETKQATQKKTQSKKVKKTKRIKMTKRTRFE